jgi:transaldolase
MPTESPLVQLHRLGQSPWLDFLSRRLIEDGELDRLVAQRGLRGVTSNPAIFEKAISDGTTYEAAIAALAKAGHDPVAIYETLAVEDVASAADRLRKVYDASDGADGFVSLEVSPRLAHDTDGTIAEAHRLWERVARPNLMIKVPGTDAGLPAIRRLLAEGINVNITLLFGLGRYREVAETHLAALEERAAAGGDVRRVASVASFFLSRIDTLVDGELEKLVASGGPTAAAARALLGEAALACARSAYAIFRELVGSARFAALVRRGARPQRVLWASTGTKNPAYSDLKYVEPLIGPHTVNTMPLETLEAYHDHGRPEPRLERDDGGHAARVLQRLAELGIDLDAVNQQLVAQGVKKFQEPFDALLASIGRRARRA